MAQINVGGSLGVPGSAAILGNYNVVFASDADHTMSAVEYSNKFLEITGTISAIRKLIAPLNQGQEFVIQNNTTDGYSIEVTGTSGTGVIVPNQAIVSVVCDGTNYTPSDGILAGDVTGTASSNTVVKIQGISFVAGAPTADQFVVAKTSSSYGPVTLSGDVQISGGPGIVEVTAIQGVPISTVDPVAGNVLTYDGSQWTPSGGGGGLTIGGIIWSPIDAQSGSVNGNALSGNQQCGTMFTMRKPNQTITGIRFQWYNSDLGGATVKVSLWNVSTNARLASTFVNIAGQGVYSGTFATPVSVSVNVAYIVSAIKITGLPGYTYSYPLTNDPTSFPFFGGPYLDWISFAVNASSDVYPSNTSATERYAVEPIFQ